MYLSSTTVAKATVTPVAASDAWLVLIAENPDARQRCVFNDSTANLYLKWGAGVTVTNYTVRVGSGGFYEFPTAPLYVGQVTAMWSAADGRALVTEV